MSTQSHATATQTPSLPQVQILLGPYSIDVIKTWLKYKKLPFSAGSRAEIAKRVHKLIESGKLSYDDLSDGLIGIEESASKQVHLYSVEPEFDKVLDKHLSQLKPTLSDRRTPANATTKTPKAIYTINNSKEFRMKWAEVQTRVTLDPRTLTPKKVPLPRVVVFALDKKTGSAHIRYDIPLQEHSHKV